MHSTASTPGVRRRLALSLALLVASGLLLAAIFGSSFSAGAQNAVQPIDEQAALLQDESNTISIVETYGLSVVAINVTAQGRQMVPEDILENIPEQFRDFFGPRFNPGQPRQQRSAGSGFVIDEQGRIITNLHVVQAALAENGTDLAENASVTVRFQGADEALPVRVIGANPDIDVALLELEDTSALPETAQPIPVADSNEVRVGQKVVAIGNPFGLQSTVTTGIVSAIERDRPGFAGLDIPFIQTDAAINPGNSGGPLLNSRGELVGINNAIISPSGGFAGIGFAVPSNLLTDNLAELQEGGLSGFVGRLNDPGRPVIGITGGLTVDDYPEAVRDSLELPETGVIITDVNPGSPAEEAGILGPQFGITTEGRELPAGGDILIAIDGSDVTSIRDVQEAVLELSPGDTVELSLWRQGETRTVEVRLASAADLNGDEEN